MVKTNVSCLVLLFLSLTAGAIPTRQTDVSVPDVLVLEPSGALVTTETGTFRIRALVRSRIPLVGVMVRLNGATIWKDAIDGSTQERQRYLIDFETPLRVGTNVVEITARNEKTSTKPNSATIVYAPREQSAQPNLAVLAIGVSRSKSSGLNSKLASANAQAFAKLMSAQQAGGLYQAVQTKVVTGEEVTRATILESLKWLQSQRKSPNDLNILYLSGNLGVQYADSSLYFLTSQHEPKGDFELADFRYQLFWDLLNTDGNTIIFADTCWLDGGPKFLIERTTQVVSKARIDSYFSSADGVLSNVDENAPTSVFTTALLEGLAGKANLEMSGERTDRIIDTHELQTWIRWRMEVLTGGKQTPLIQVSPRRFAIVKLAGP